MQPAPNRNANAIRAAVRTGLGKAEPSDAVRDPTKDSQEAVVDAMDLDDGEGSLVCS
jgi:hypothetical protein